MPVFQDKICLGCSAKLQQCDSRVCRSCRDFTVKLQSHGFSADEIFSGFSFEATYEYISICRGCTELYHEKKEGTTRELMVATYAIPKIIKKYYTASIFGYQYRGPMVYFDLEATAKSCGRCESKYTLIDVKIVTHSTPKLP